MTRLPSTPAWIALLVGALCLWGPPAARAQKVKAPTGRQIQSVPGTGSSNQFGSGFQLTPGTGSTNIPGHQQSPQQSHPYIMTQPNPNVGGMRHNPGFGGNDAAMWMGLASGVANSLAQPGYQAQQGGGQYRLGPNTSASTGFFQQPGYGYDDAPYSGYTRQGYYYPQQGNYVMQQPATGYQSGYYQPQAGNATQQPVTSQAYQVPAEYAGAAAGSVISYGGYNYQILGNGTMVATTAAATAAPGTTYVPQQPQQNVQQQQQQAAAGPVAGQRYQVPGELAGTAAGTVITYQGYNYLVGGDGTMVLHAGAVPARDTEVKLAAAAAPAAPVEPTPGQRFALPEKFASAKPGEFITYGGRNYLVGNDGMMTYFNAPAPGVGGTQKPAEPPPVPGQRYPLPDAFAGSTPGSVITHNGYDYVVNNDGTMTYVTLPAARPR